MRAFAHSNVRIGLLARPTMPDELLDAVAVVGSESEVRSRIDAYAAAGLTEIGLVVPPLDSPSGLRTLQALAP